MIGDLRHGLISLGLNYLEFKSGSVKLYVARCSRLFLLYRRVDRLCETSEAS